MIFNRKKESAGDTDPSAVEGVTPEPSAPEPPTAPDVSTESSSTETAPSGEMPSPVPAESADKELIGLRTEKDQLYNQLLTLKAEFENYRKRIDRDRPALVRYGREELLQKLLPLYDVLLSAHEQVAARGEGESTKDLVIGLELIFSEFTKLFKAEGIKILFSVGKPYDYNEHEVVGHVETDEHPEGTVVEEVQRGYRLEDKVLRHAKVRVAKKKA